MEILKLVPVSERWKEFREHVDNQLHFLRLDDFSYSWRTEERHISLICTSFPTNVSKDEVKEIFRRFFCTAISNYMVEVCEQQIIKHKIKHAYGFENKHQIKSIFKYCYSLLFYYDDRNERDERKVNERKSLIFDCTYHHLKEGSEFHLDGFIRFRLKEYIESLDLIIEYAIDEYILDQEYQDFIQLLRYVITEQEPKIPFLHVYHIQDREFILFNEEGEVITEQDFDFFSQKGIVSSFAYEDMIVSSLITLSPEKFTLHTTTPEQPVIKTLQAIFQDKMRLCLRCDHCQMWNAAEYRT